MKTYRGQRTVISVQTCYVELPDDITNYDDIREEAWERGCDWKDVKIIDTCDGPDFEEIK